MYYYLNKGVLTGPYNAATALYLISDTFSKGLILLTRGVLFASSSDTEKMISYFFLWKAQRQNYQDEDGINGFDEEWALQIFKTLISRFHEKKRLIK